MRMKIMGFNLNVLFLNNISAYAQSSYLIFGMGKDIPSVKNHVRRRTFYLVINNYLVTNNWKPTVCVVRLPVDH